VVCVHQANPELMSQAMNMFGQMNPEQLATMSSTMAAAGQGGQPSAAAMSEMLANPQSAKMIKDMMSALTPEQLVSMSEAAGQLLTPEQVLIYAVVSLCSLRPPLCVRWECQYVQLYDSVIPNSTSLPVY
jgi:hypothetical protein